MKRSVLTMAVWLILIAGCSKDEPSPKAPGAFNLVFPEDNSLCITGVSQSPSTSLVTFRWEAATNTDSYELRIRSLASSGVLREVTRGTSADVVIDKGTPYLWQVTAINQESGEKTTSAEWQFFNAGSSITYPPFPPRLLQPGSGASVFPDSNNQVFLVWEAADADNDLEEIEVYFGTDPDELPFLVALCCQAERLQVTVTSGSVYYWQVLSRDTEGNTSRSAIYSFRVL